VASDRRHVQQQTRVSISNFSDPIFFNKDCAVPDLPPAMSVQKRGAFDNEWSSLRPSHVNGD
jgi:hypothetical protein